MFVNSVFADSSQLDDSVRLVQMIEETGVAALAIHGRLTEERPRHPVRTDTIRALAAAVNIPVIAKYVQLLWFGTGSDSSEYNLLVG